MRKILFSLVLMALSTSYGCSSDEDAKNSNLPTCSITSPQDGDIIDLFEDLVIKGTASDGKGEGIAKVALTINGSAVPEVSKVPFEYTILAKDLKEGLMKIALTVTNSSGKSATHEVSVVVQDNSEAPECSITAPGHGSDLNVFTPFEIKGEGDPVSGEISKVTLKINTEIIAEVTSLPFAHTVAAESYPIGNYTITLEVENNRGKIAKDMVAVTLSDLNIAPACSITAPADESSYELEDAIVIKGTGSDEDGTIAGVALKINDQVVESVTQVPFEYTLEKQYKEAGNVRVVLEVTDNNGKTSSDEITVIILGQFREFTDTRDNKTYQIVKIGEQLWFAENLAYLPSVYLPTEDSETEPRYYVYDYNGNDVAEAKATDSYKTRGVLYNWSAAGGSKDSKNDDLPSGIQGPCPEGWHVPSEAEWTILYDYVRNRIPDEEAALYWDGVTWMKNVSGHLRSKGDWPISSDMDFPQLAQGGFDTYGFKGQVTGTVLSRMFYKGPDSGGSALTFWTPHYDAVTYPSNPGGVTTSMNNYRYETDFGRGTDLARGYSVRCLQD